MDAINKWLQLHWSTELQISCNS